MKLSQTNGPILHFYDGDLHSSLVHLKNAGFKYVDISFWSRYLSGSPYFKTDNEIIAEEYKRELETLELIPVQSHEPFGNSLGNDGGRFYFRKTPLAIDLAGKIGIPSITLHAGIEVPAMSMSREEYMSKNAEIFRKLIPYAEKYGTRLLIENIAWKNDGIHLATADDLNEMLDRIDHPLFGVCWDTGHANLCNLDQYEEIKKLGSRLEGLHVHDNYGGKRTPGCDLHLFPYWGNINFDAVISALIEIDYKGTFNFEVDSPIRRVEPIPFVKNGEEQKKLDMMSPELRQKMEIFLYEIGKQMLETYNCFEE
ncbi:MAG: sugar phosphate isomerase/epimerase [Clostridia bacterium]|nr:sugar phosphate isomerase/epimerase [Clostridia bacterium]